MISEKSRLLNRMMTCLSLDKEDPTALKIQIDKLIQYLHEFRFFVPPRQFEEAVKLFLKNNVVNKVQLGDHRVFPAICNSICQLAENIVERATNELVMGNLATKDELVDQEVAKYLKERTRK
jgi:hypothetical protein